jgi:CDP-diacylglycerol---serine O-phosphatidyltransferase
MKKIRRRISRFKKNKNKIDAVKKRLSFLPHLFTLGNAFFGFCSIVFAAHGEIGMSGRFILLGALMDMLDGRIARLMGVASDLGVELDSLSDLISFCVAPAFLIYVWQLKSFGFLGIVICSVFALAGLMRLARFNIIHEQQTIYFLGVPTTVAGCFLVSLVLYATEMTYDFWLTFFLALLILILSWLMVSSVQFPTFKKSSFKFKNRYLLFAFIILFAFVAVMQFHVTLFSIFVLYFLYSFIRFFAKSRVGKNVL